MASGNAHFDNDKPADQHGFAELEKPGDSHVEDVETDSEFGPADEKRILRRVDRRLVVTCGIMFCFSLMDRTNHGAAAIAGMAKEMELIQYRYSLIALVFFVTYVLIQPFAIVLCRYIGPRLFLASITLTWGVTIMCFGFASNWTVLLGLRLLLGALEGGFFPACVYLISTWYKRYEVQSRFALFYLLGCFASALAGILAYGFMQMNGLGGYGGWRWIFIMEGLLTILIGAGGYFLLVDFPDRAATTAWNFLSEQECQFVIRRIAQDRDDAELEPFNLGKWARAGLDWKVWGFGLLFFCNGTVAYAIAFFLPIVLQQNLGFSVAAAQCLVAPPYAFAAIVMYVTSYFSDQWRLRAPVLIFNAVIGLIGLPIMGFASNSAARYFGIVLVTGGVTANFPAVMAYQAKTNANNVRGQWKRAFCSASLVGLGSIGGIAGALVFRDQDAPEYHPGIWAIIACNLLVVIIVCIMTIHFRICNKKVDRGTLVIEGLPGFKYTI
ncbi:retrograde regulation protein 2 [Thozetella sp. PMI_491]|nr:retrograde regulation protein 2 [Thozetella sp. PMI_491]